MSQPEFGPMGRHYLQSDSYGAAAFCFYRAVLEDSNNSNAWNGLVLAMSLMRREYDAQTVLARFALQAQLPYDKDMVTFAMMMYQQSPIALSEWVRAMSKRFGVGAQEKSAFAEMADELETAYNEMAARQGVEALKEQGMLNLEEFAGRRMELDWLLSESVDDIYRQIGAWLEHPDTVLNAIRMLCMLPDNRSEKLLRRACRNEQLDGKVRTHALLALRWLGVRGNARIHKMGESFVINLDDPQPELTISVPASYKPALDRMKLRMAQAQGLVSAEEYEAFASTDEPELPEALAEKVNEAEIPGLYQEVVHALIRAAYDQYYPLVPTIKGTRDWSAAFLMLMKDYVTGIGDPWNYGELEQIEMAVRHRNWLLSASPDFYESIETIRQMRARHAGTQEPQPEQSVQE
ncbi:HEAT repeat domain-containing protein [Paenibacillus filicis]|uniref:HEAT repeat domain-containing protein n=1 Tax=Paenibacillus gyeongsangnamensis TaxID=3388067 RepID=A0ABT4QKW9_9BACL|nr:HEAT repeat domain-containing protein [Paenibacillus filicis]MCZ8517519.1 HEAT repeat domain-containing protein [Paenibacillus filicis]